MKAERPNINRLLAAFRRQKLDRVPNFEVWIGPRSIAHCLGRASYDLDFWTMPPAVIPYWLEWGVEACHPLQSGANDIYAFKAKYGDRLCPVGNISVALLSSGTADEVRADTRRHIEALAKDGGYVVCSDHSIVASVLPENFLAMVATAHEFGQY
ncbi:MAG: uroporphyrinogen decarboxylase family protein [Lentisphaeria bacterium]